MMSDKRRAEIERAIAEAEGPWFGSKGVELSCMARIARELLNEIDRLKSAERLFGDALSLLSAAFASDGSCKGLIRLGQSYINDGIPAMVREIVGLRGEVVELKESLVSRSELAATTIAGLEMEVEKAKAERDAVIRAALVEKPPGRFTIGLGLHVSVMPCGRDEAISLIRQVAHVGDGTGEPVADRADAWLWAENERLKAECDTLRAALHHREGKAEVGGLESDA